MTADPATTASGRLPDATTPPVEPAHPARLDERRVPSWKKPFLALDQEGFRHLWLGMLPGTMAMQMGMITTG
ncbi:MAG TPA: hypothetical protein PKA95_18655 [Thermomicrobiales bacterium]|nr:hypothetical protein [Thermomicrobiales bacterium]